MTTALFELRVFELGISTFDEENLTIGFVLDLLVERSNDANGEYKMLASQSDFDSF